MPITIISHPIKEFFPLVLVASWSRLWMPMSSKCLVPLDSSCPTQHICCATWVCFYVTAWNSLGLQTEKMWGFSNVRLLLLAWDNCGAPLACLRQLWGSFCLSSLSHASLLFFVILRFSVSQTASVYYFNYNGISGPHDSILDQSRNVLPLILDLHANYVIHKPTSKREIWKMIWKEEKKTSRKLQINSKNKESLTCLFWPSQYLLMY